MRVEDFNYKLKIIPHKSGCYLYFSEDHEIIYVGKSKNLYNRVNSYFNSTKEHKTLMLVNEVYDFEYIITNNELESLLLELNLIKKHMPRYNIKLKDDSAYPYIELTTDVDPRLKLTQKPTNVSSIYFGPYPNARSAVNVVKLLNKIYPLRKCRVLLKKPCIYYQMGQCLAPCINHVDPRKYDLMVRDIKAFLKGDNSNTIKELETKMDEASCLLNYEQALEYKKLIDSIKKVNAKQTINVSKIVDMDFLSYDTLDDKICIVTMFMRGGKISARDYLIADLNDDAYTIFSSFVLQYYYNIKALPNEIVLLEAVDGLSDIVKKKIVVPIKGQKRKIVLLGKENAKDKLVEASLLHKRKLENTVYANTELRKILGMKTLHTIEMFDNSNLGGKSAVSAMIRYLDGEPDRNNYRKYNIKTVEGIDDFKSMREVVYRRYYRLLIEGQKMPDLLIMDGGVGQVSSALEIINSLDVNIRVIGLKKNNFHKTEAIIDSDLTEIKLDKKTRLYHLLDNIQEEVHRYAITFHRSKFQKTSHKSILDEIEGVGPKRKRIILSSFTSIEAMAKASLDDFQKIGIPNNIAKRIIDKAEGISKNEN